MKQYHSVADLAIDDRFLTVRIDGTVRQFRIADISRKLCAASPQQREIFEISPSGYGIHWPLLDEDLSIDGLLNIHHSPSAHDAHRSPQQVE